MVSRNFHGSSSCTMYNTSYDRVGNCALEYSGLSYHAHKLPTWTWDYVFDQLRYPLLSLREQQTQQRVCVPSVQGENVTHFSINYSCIEHWLMDIVLPPLLPLPLHFVLRLVQVVKVQVCLRDLVVSWWGCCNRFYPSLVPRPYPLFPPPPSPPGEGGGGGL